MKAKKTERLFVRISKADKDGIMAYCRENNVSLSDLIVSSVPQYHPSPVPDETKYRCDCGYCDACFQRIIDQDLEFCKTHAIK